MKWIILLAALGGVFWVGNLSYHLLDNGMFITNYWKAHDPVEWGIVHFNKSQLENSEVYAFNAVQGNWGILKELWPIPTLLALVFFALIPVTVFISNSLTNLQITNANYEKKLAKERAENTEIEADKKVSYAQTEARKRANAEFMRQFEQLEAGQRDLQEREALISAREKAALDAEMAAQQKVDEVIGLYEQELARFEAEISAMQSAKNNAQQAFKRIKQKTAK
ncbi:hypothetical protein PY479_17370 [Shewanella sp. A32]|uniref:hypothetical protein n=1 Tax=Shewanella sp. A32 TaxID=3031327 RepID=UPI0023B945E7|nr:hypothetical protein [Shewanella sp. A32]MDF0536031.1 hypothetical protein [Shewanella sp. A32]